MKWFPMFVVTAAVALISVLQFAEPVGVFQVAREVGTRPGSFFYHIEDGYYYHQSHQRGETIYFKCIRYPRCGGRAMFDPVDGFDHTIPHRDDRVCYADVHYAAECELRRRIIQRCRQLDYAPFFRIIEEESIGYHVDVRTRFTEDRMRTSMRNARRANYPPPPQTLRQLTRILMAPAFNVLTMTSDGEDNFYAGSVTDALNAHHVVFASRRMLDQMAQFVNLHCDGTFKVRPAGLPVEQVFCIVGVWNHRIVPLAWALMETRTTEAYISVLRLLENLLGPNISLRRFIMDFEPAEMLAVETVFQCRVQGCAWHAIRRFLTYVGDRGLLRPMRIMEPVRRIIRMTMALPLLPQNLIRRGMVLITQEAMDEGPFVYAMLRPYLQDIYRLWIRSDRRIRQMCVFGSSQRTNNACESHNRRLRETLGIHPNIYAFLDGIRRLEQRASDDVYRLQHFRRAGRSRASRSIMNDQRLQELGQVLLQPRGNRDREIMRYIRGASHVMDGVLNEAMQ